MSLTSIVSRWPQDYLRVPALMVLFPFAMVSCVLRALLPVRWGGHPHKRRLLCADFYTMPLDLYLAGMRGFFVPDDRR
jgi:hypothetical protein